MCLNIIGICMNIVNLWEITEVNLKMVTVLAMVYYVARILIIVDSRLAAMNEENDDRAVVIEYRIVIADLVQLLEDQ